MTLGRCAVTTAVPFQVVFDGASLPAKGVTADARRARREGALSRAAALQAGGRREEAEAVLAQSVTITHDMTHELIVALRFARNPRC